MEENTTLNSIFSNIDSKLKTIAKIIFVVGIALNIIASIVMFSMAGNECERRGIDLTYAYRNDYTGVKIFVSLGIAFLVIGTLWSIFSAFKLYGFAELIANSKTLVETNREISLNTYKE
jgi:hypothetical protein